MDYGSFQQANLNYNLLEGSLFFIIYKIEALARFSASIGRLEGFQSNMNSAVGMIGSFLAAGALIVAPAAAALIWVSQKDALSR